MPIIRGVKGALAQLGERNTGSVEVSGSIPLGSTKKSIPRTFVRGIFLSEFYIA